MQKENGKYRLTQCLLNDSHFFEEVVLKKTKKKKLSPLLLTLLCLTTSLEGGYYSVHDVIDNPTNAGVGTLRHAILMANNDPNPSIILLPDSRITLQGDLPTITSPKITFVGMGTTQTLLDGQGKFSGLLSNNSVLTSQNVSFQNINFLSGRVAIGPGSVLFVPPNASDIQSLELYGDAKGPATFKVNESGSRSHDLINNRANGQNVLAVASGQRYAISGEISGDGGLLITGGGTVDLQHQANQYRGTTTVDKGTTLGLAQNGALPDTSLSLNGTLTSTGSALTLSTPIRLGQESTLHADVADMVVTAPLTEGGKTLHLDGNTGRTLSIQSSGANTYSGHTYSTVPTLQTSGANPFGNSTLHVDKTSQWTLTGATTINSPIQFNTTTDLVAVDEKSHLTGPIGGNGNVHYTASNSASLQIEPRIDNREFTGQFHNDGATLLVGGNSPLGSSAATYKVSEAGTTKFIKDGNYLNKIEVAAGANPLFIADAGTKSNISGEISSSETANIVSFNGPGTIALTGGNTFKSHEVALSNDLLMQTKGSSPFGDSQNIVSLNGTTLEFIGDGIIENSLVLNHSPTLIANTKTSTVLKGTLKGDFVVGTTNGPQAGTIALAGNNASFNNKITLNKGTVQVAEQANLGNGTLLLNGHGGKLELLSNGQTYVSDLQVSPSSHQPSGFINLSPSSENTWAGKISGAGDLEISGPASLNLSGDNSSHTGNLYVRQTNIKIASPNNIGTGPIHFGEKGGFELTTGNNTLANFLYLERGGGTLFLPRETNNTWSGPFGGNFPLTIEGEGTLNLTNNNSSFTGGFQLNKSILAVESPQNLGEGAITIKEGELHLVGNQQFFPNPIVLEKEGGTVVTAGADNTLAGPISGSGPLTLVGSNPITLIGHNNYTGNTYLAGNLVQIGNTSPLGTGDVVFDGGHLQAMCTTTLTNDLNLERAGIFTVNEGVKATVIGSLSGTSSFTKLGAGTLAIQGNSPYYSGNVILQMANTEVCGTNPLGTGPLTLDGGSIEFTCDSSLGNSSITLGATTTFIADPLTVSTISSPISETVSSGFTSGGTGTIILTGTNTYTGPTTITAGTLQIDGTQTSSATVVQVGGTLSGIGSVQDVDVFGTLSPGDGSGSLTTTRTTFEKGSIFNVDLDGTPYSSLLSTGDVRIRSGSLLMAEYDPYLPMTYTIIHADGFVTGRFLPLTTGSARFPVTTRYDLHNVFLTVSEVPFADIPLVGNTHNIAVCFDSLIATPTPELEADLAVLNGLSVAELGAAFEQFDPGIYNALSYAEEANAQRVRRVYTQHGFDRQFDCNLCGSIWTAFYGEEIEQHHLKDGQAFAGYKDYFNGIVVGLDGQFYRNTLASVGFSYAKSDLRWTNVNDAKASIDSYTGFIGGTWYTYPFMIDAFGSYTRNVVSGHRSIFIAPSTTIPPPPGTAPIEKLINYDCNSSLYAAHLGMLSKRDLNRCFFALSYANLDYYFVKREPFNEKGGGATNLSVHGQNSDLLLPEVGFGFGVVSPAINCGTLIGDVRVGFVKELRFMGHSSDNNFTGNGCNFTVGGLFPRQNLVAASVNFLLTGAFGFDLSFDFYGLYGSHYSDSSGKAEIVFVF